MDHWCVQLAYKFGELVEVHAADTYAEFVDANEALLKTLPPPVVALEYYKGEDLYLFEEFSVRACTPSSAQGAGLGCA